MPDLDGVDAANNFYKKLQKYQPTDESDRWRRALYFSTAIGIRCLDLLSDYMRYCLRPNTMGETPDYSMSEKSPEIHHQAVKELLGLSIWLTMVDQLQGDVPLWLREFFIDCWAAADKLYPCPSSQEIMTLYENQLGADKICEAVSSRLCYKLELEDTKGDACIKLGEMLQENGKARADLLFYALSAKHDALDKSIDQLKNY
ncbi:MAG TPA: hypothetical protein PKZ32_22780 [Candidatus Melainabacteria bacterium]|nr:hypothetical protein [Candidatus Melainabacteria bacterium]